MKAVHVQYTVRPEFADENRANIRKVMDRLRAEPIEGMCYSSHTLEDGCTFVHFNVARDGETLGRLQEVEEFKAFQRALRESGPTAPPKATHLETVGVGFDL